MILQDSKEFIGATYGRLNIINDLGIINQHRTVEAICECGNKTKCRLSHLKAGRIKSCGCLSIELIIERSTKHGLCNHQLYDVWNGMKQRCYYKKDINYKNYGGRGVTICQEWLDSFIVFFNWAISNGWKDGLQLDKDILYPNGMGMCYCPKYCCFITSKENLRKKNNSRMIEYNGDEKSMAHWCEELGLKYSMVSDRLYSGWSVSEAFLTPKKS